ncbi:hypothetical protein DFQ27_005993 [Actinomortierella ambigua]|uniref:Uncharacterized protein n=1 Tax=Actinomortierella ambigua TaxID=1343610 RepID=A0A9P6PZ02_9FUNG|nr:hypothetical protein DFQ26_007802 [Actinomortierella ambigua]KAG0255936.1 hypothetical protein DFQ27_005993 [Actinomortierella ambigua]
MSDKNTFHEWSYSTTPSSALRRLLENPDPPPANPLRLKDVFHVARDYDPRFTYTHLDIPPESALPLLLSFNSDGFRTFWANERVAYDWTHSSSSTSRKFYREKADPESLLPVKSVKEFLDGSRRGAPPLYDWTLKFQCRRYRPATENTISRESIGQNCKAYVMIRKIIGKDIVQVEYYWKHTHDTSTKARTIIPMGPNERHYVSRMVEDGHDWKSIQQELRPSEEQPPEEPQNNTAAPRSIAGFRISYRTVRDARYRKRRRVTKDSDDPEGVQQADPQLDTSDNKASLNGP